jgi:hypothetical protein
VLPIFVVFAAEFPRKHGLFVPANEHRHRQCDHGCVDEKVELPENERLSHDDGEDGEIHRIANVAVRAIAQWCDRSRSAGSFRDEAGEGVDEECGAGNNQHGAKEPEGPPAGKRCLHFPARQPPWKQARDPARREEEERSCADGRVALSHADYVRTAADCVGREVLEPLPMRCPHDVSAASNADASSLT